MAMNRVPRKWTIEEYLAYEKETGIRHEFIDGEIYAMSDSTNKHSLIGTNAIIAMGRHLDDKSCQVHGSDMRLKISDIKYVYPDVSVVCGKPDFADEEETMLTNPTLVIEVLSSSTENYDKGTKATFYRSLSSIQAYLLLDQSRVYAELQTRQTDGWLIKEFKSVDDIIPLKVIDCELPLSEVYRGIEFSEE